MSSFAFSKSVNLFAFDKSLFGRFNTFDKAYADGIIDGVFGTNLTYRSPELLSRPWFHEVDVSKYIAYIIATLNHDMSASTIIDPHEKIKQLLAGRK